MSMLVGAALAASTLLGAGPAAADTPPVEFGDDWHDPVTAAPPVAKPHTKSCEVTVAEARFKDFTPYKGDYAPPAKCGKGSWGKVVLRLDGKVKGRQYDRLGYLRIGGVEVLRTSTPEPSVDGITWTVEKDVTRYRETLSRDQQVEMLIGNVVNDTYTGVIDVKATLTFYEAAKPTAAPDRVLPLGDASGDGRDGGVALTTPRNSERIVAEVYATGSGGGCEEYWYLTVPDAAPYSCKADRGPYREVQVKVDGQLAGIAAPFPTVWTGGWSNPFLWYVIPGPRAFDIKPIEYDLTPFAGVLNDGRPHRVEVSVVGVPEAQTGWSTPVNVLVWQDEKSDRVTGRLTGHKESTLSNTSKYTPGTGGDEPHRLDTEGGHRLHVSGYVNTSHGRVATTVTRSLANTSLHRWTDGESTDALKATWTDRETVTTGRRAVRSDRTYTMDGTTTLGAGDRLRTRISLGDRAESVTRTGGRRTGWSVLDDRYDGDATYTANVPRDQRHAVGTSRERYRLVGDSGCYDRTLSTVQGTLTEDRRRC
ncbi:peptide-N4-asparagine amidase A [Streptomyces sp. SID335]|uniref:Peptide-N4-asparagine amidase A n=2 Tax=Streptomyces TaxID=1883 RepID=A0A5P2B656_STRVZ|nr:peptide-N4-asparagine amidase A [Streptomyces sp. SID335]MYZ17301.1 peptide-N4-asparagine amidase A [Streptomyces sp. SID337]NDZ84053.1 peptide-N4-asparagine amidase A [Streptomyces sp. SID10115]NEA00859.1 peptide-N4-asparagine amidase A [Streptomyces sp. SID10116]NEB45989.1 peptide-N4-asparagine amidase A [Streptomyces sp. SID339]QES25400.1 peptide-N4-asparagine amidase A [Streptomyces venezuelae]